MILLTEKIENILLILGLLLAPLTSLRVWKIGPGELLLFLWCLLVMIRRRYIVINLITKFWYIFIFLVTIGTLFGNAIITQRAIEIDEFFTYVFFTLFITSLVTFFDGNNNVQFILKRIYWLDLIFFTFLFLYGTYVGQSIFGMKLWFAGVRFTGGALNPHQFAYTSAPMVIAGLYLASEKNSFLNKFLTYASVIPFFVMSTATFSATLTATFAILFFLFIFLSLMNDKNSQRRTKKIIIFSILIIIIILLSAENLYEIFINFVYSDPNGPGRFELWYASINTWKLSPIVGLGLYGSAGAERGIRSEAHNTYFQLLLNSGIIGLSLYLYFVYKLGKFTIKSKYAFLLVMFFVLYGFGGYSFRRVYMWYFTITAYYLVKTEDNT